jgi:glycosyltransferase involved in cell wall biosynthesis
MTNLSSSAEPHLLVDGRPLNGSHNGITRFVEQLMAAWPLSSGFRTTLVSNQPIRSNISLPASINCLYDNHPLSLLPGTLWMTARMPSLARQLGATHFLGTQHVLPLWGMRCLTQGVIVHDLVFKIFPKTMTKSNRLLTGYFCPRSIKRADRIFCVSQTTLSDLRGYFGAAADRAVICYPGRTLMSIGKPVISMASDYTHQSGNTIGLLVVGSIEPRKNIARFLEAFLLAADLNPLITLDLVSGDAWGDVLGEATCVRMIQHPRIRIHQRITDEALNTLYKSADYLVFPSLYEGFGLPIIEAVGHCAVIANDIPVFREIAEFVDGIHLMNLQAPPADIARKLAALTEFDAPAAADDYGKFSWKHSAECILSEMLLAPKLC